MTTLIAAVGVLVAAFGALIAYFQWRTAHQRVVLDLLERRLAVFQDIEEGARGVLNATSRVERQKSFWRYVKAEANAKFLFGAEINTLLAKHRSDIAAIMSFSEIGSEHPEYNKLIDRMQKAEHSLGAFIQNSAEPFAPYMRLDQKMPSLWWPIKCGNS